MWSVRVVVPAIQLLAENIKEIITLLENFAIALGIGLAGKLVLVIGHIANMVRHLGFLRVALLGVGGPVGAMVLGLTGAVAIFRTLREEAMRTEEVMAEFQKTVAGLTDEWIKAASAAELTAGLQNARKAWADIENQLVSVRQKLKELRANTPDEAEEYHAGIKQYVDEVDRLTKAQDDAFKAINNMKVRLRDFSGVFDPIVVTTKRWAVETGKATKELKDLDKMMVKVNGLTQDQQDWVNRLTDEYESAQEELKRYNEQLQRLRDIGDPIGAMVREFNEQQAVLNRALADGKIKVDEYQRILNTLSDQLGKAADGTMDVAQESDSMVEAMREGVRILERSFNGIWESLFDGSKDAFDSIRDGFESMLAYLQNAASTRKIFLQIENAFDPDKSVDFKMLGEGLAALAGQLAGGALGGGGQYANIGAGIGALAGSLIPGLGNILGPIIGGALGGVLGGLFDSDRPAILQVSGFDTSGLSGSDTDNVLDTIFGQTFLRSRRVAQADIEAFMDVIAEFDAGLATFLEDEQIGKIAEALKDWNKQIEGETLSAEQLLESRFTAILATFSDDIRAFVNEVGDLEQQAARLQVGVSAESLYGAQPELFSGRTVKEFLAVVDAVQNGTESITDTFNRLVTVIDGIVRLTTFLDDFASSDLGSEFDALLMLQGLNIGQQLARANSELMDAVAGFDGSVAGLENIASLISTVREGEIRYLTQLDSLQKGLNANLDKLQAEILGLTELPKTGADLFNDARDLVQQVLNATSAEDVSAIEQQFLGLIRAIGEEDQIRLQQPILQLINSFRAAANDVIGDFRGDALDNAASVRDLVDVFTDQLGDPLAIIAATNERAAAALEAISNGRDPSEPDPLEPVEQAGPVDTIIAANELAAETQQRIMEEGLREIARTMADGNNLTAAALANAIRNADFRVVVNLKPSDLSTR